MRAMGAVCSFWYLLQDCRIPAGQSEMPMPYKCPMDHIFEPSLWYYHKVAFREPGVHALGNLTLVEWHNAAE